MTPEQELEKFKAQLQIEVEHHKADIQQEVQRANAAIDAHYDHWRLTIERETQGKVAMFSGIITFAVVALRSIILVNGGSAVALLAFLGHIWDSNDQLAQAAAASSRSAMVAFVVGTLAGCAASMFAYLAQTCLAELTGWKRKWFGEGSRFVATILAAAGLISFGCGALRAVAALSGSATP